MKLAILNPTTWGYPAFVVEMRHGEILRVVESTDDSTELPTDLTDYEIEEYPVGTRFQALFDDVYPEDDPGCCMYEHFEPVKA